jgi:hypothetical protein
MRNVEAIRRHLDRAIVTVADAEPLYCCAEWLNFCMVGPPEVIGFISQSRGPLTTILPLLPRRFQPPIALGLNLLPIPSLQNDLNIGFRHLLAQIPMN